MRTILCLAALCCAPMVLVACDGGDPDDDGGIDPGMDAGMRRDGATPEMDAGPNRDNDACIPQIEICGDRIDQDCDGMETPCGDSDMDQVEACRPGDDLTMCDCDDSRADVRPPFGSLPGAPEVCDGVDNDCNGRVDEAAECCAGCDGVDPSRADICVEGTGECDCSTEPGIGPCPMGEECCMVGCTDTQTDFDNCGFCNSACTDQADNCSGGDCHCGSGPVCEFVNTCNAGSCG